MSRLTSGAPRLRSLTVLAIGIAAACTLTACTAGSGTGPATGPTKSASPAPAPQGVVTKQAAAELLDTYERANNRANKARNEQLLATVESGQVNEQSRADYQLWKAWPKKRQAEYQTSFFYQKRSYFIPRAGTGTASWFAVKATSSYGDRPQVLLIFDRVDGTYKMVMSLWASPGESLPQPVLDRDGFAEPADPSKAVGTLAPAQLGATYEDFFETGGAKKASQAFAPTDASKGSVQVYRDRGRDGNLAGYATKEFVGQTPAHPAVYALRLADGGILAAFPTSHTQEVMLKPQYLSSFQIGPNPEEAVYDPAKRIGITDVFQGQGLAEMSPKGKAKVLTIEYQMTDSR
ncbi:hypothetical protein ACWDBD_21830 [Streptomyces sp. NPDC001118]